ncbi:MAG: YeeE/YedE family protein [Caulobacteraceae bacterium]
MHPFLMSFLGGLMIGLSAAGLLLLHGRIAGVSDILFRAAWLQNGGWRWAFLGGLLLSGVLARLAGMAPSPTFLASGLPLLFVAGLLVGLGSRLGNGCTSGHGVCGMARLSPRSLAATATFMVVAAAVVFLVRHTPLLGPIR